MRIAKLQAVVVAETDKFKNELASAQKTAAVFQNTTSRRFKTLSKDLSLLMAASGEARKNFDALFTRLKNNAALQNAGRSFHRVAKSLNLNATEANKLRSNLGLSQKLESEARSANVFSSSLEKLKYAAGGYLSVNALQNVARTSINISSIQKTFFALTGSSSGTKAEMFALREEAQRLGLDFFALADSFKGFSVAGKTAGMDVAQVKEIFSSVTEASSVLGLNAQKTGLALS